MKLIPRTILSLALAMLIAAPLMAADKKKERKNKKKGRKQVTAPVFRLPSTITLSADQKTKLSALKKQYGAKLAAAQKAVQSILTPEQRKAQAKARKDAKEAKKNGKELRAAVEASTNLSDDQKKKMRTARKASTELNKEVKGKVMAILTAEQKAKLPSNKKKSDAKPKKKKKKKKKKKSDS